MEHFKKGPENIIEILTQPLCHKHNSMNNDYIYYKKYEKKE